MPPQPGDMFCALTESELANVGVQCRWPQKTVTVCQRMDLSASAVTADQIWTALNRICTLWSNVCGLELRAVDAPSAANVLARSGRIDGPNGVLGQSYLPCGNVSATSQLAQLLDDGEHWTLDFLQRVWLHELGHAIGLDHAPQGSGAIMEPYLTNLAEPQPWDIAQVVARYGPRVVTPLPPTPTPIPTPTPLPPVGPAGSVTIDAPGQYLVRMNFLRPDGSEIATGGVIKFPASGVYPFRVTTTRR